MKKMRLDKLNTFKVFEKSILNNKKNIINILKNIKTKVTLYVVLRLSKSYLLIHFMKYKNSSTLYLMIMI